MHAQPTNPEDRRSHGPGKTLTSLLASGAGRDLVANLLFLAGAALLVWSAVVHLHLWAMSYRHIPTIGPLFVFQGVAAIVLAVLVVAVRRVWAALAASGFAVATLGGFVISVKIGLFGFQDSWSAPYAEMAFGVEVAAFVVLIAACARCAFGTTASRGPAPQSPEPVLG